MPAIPIALSRAPIVVGRDQDHERRRAAAVCGHRIERQHDHQEDDRQARQQDVQGDLVRCLLPGCALDQADHPVDEGLAGLRGDLHDDPVAEHAGSPGDSAAVAAVLAHDGSGFTGDRRLVDARDAGDDVAVSGDHLARFDDHDVTESEVGGRGVDGSGVQSIRVLLVVVGDPSRQGRRAGRPQRLGLGLAAALGNGLREVREQDREPEPDRDAGTEAGRQRSGRGGLRSEEGLGDRDGRAE